MTYTLAEIRPMILEIIATKPEGYRYQPVLNGPNDDDPDLTEYACRYRELDGTPSCIVGHLFHRLDVDTAERIEGLGVTVAVAHLLLDIDPTALAYLAELQTLQDKGAPWADAEQLAHDAVVYPRAE